MSRVSEKPTRHVQSDERPLRSFPRQDQSRDVRRDVRAPGLSAWGETICQADKPARWDQPRPFGPSTATSRWMFPAIGTAPSSRAFLRASRRHWHRVLATLSVAGPASPRTSWEWSWRAPGRTQAASQSRSATRQSSRTLASRRPDRPIHSCRGCVPAGDPGDRSRPDTRRHRGPV
jgi:hypothetical protein